jgi:hypothetical protein
MALVIEDDEIYKKVAQNMINAGVQVHQRIPDKPK